MRCIFFFFQAEDGIRDVAVTGVQTCALPIFRKPAAARRSIRAPPGFISSPVACRVARASSGAIRSTRRVRSVRRDRDLRQLLEGDVDRGARGDLHLLTPGACRDGGPPRAADESPNRRSFRLVALAEEAAEKRAGSRRAPDLGRVLARFALALLGPRRPDRDHGPTGELNPGELQGEAGRSADLRLRDG